MSLVLYSYYRSSAAYRVRIVLNLKGVDYGIHTIDLLKQGGEQYGADYCRLNPQGRVPALVVGDRVLTQSAAIVEYLEEAYPQPPLLPSATLDRAYVRSLCQLVACDIHPLNNLSVLNYLKTHFCDAEASMHWYRHWVTRGFSALERTLAEHGCNGAYSFGDGVTLADVFLIPQVFNALRFDCPLQDFPLITGIYQNCLALPAFVAAAPENQADAKDDAVRAAQ